MKKKFEKVFIVGMNTSTSGGPESLHQLAYKLRELGLDCSIMYADSNSTEVPEKFEKYNIPVVKQIPDSKDNLLIVPETYTEVLKKYKNIKKAIWWLSLDFYLKDLPINRTKDFSKRRGIPRFLNLFSMIGLLTFRKFKFDIYKFRENEREVYHFYNCEYVRLYLQNHGVAENKMSYLCGPLRDEYFQEKTFNKTNVVLYNPKKGLDFTKKIIKRSEQQKKNINYVPIENMTPLEISKLMSKAKVYIDFGFFPGPERIPREAVMFNCNIVTGRDGSAANDIDIPIPGKYKFEKNDENIDAIIELIEKFIVDYDNYVDDFDFYRQKVVSQKEKFNKSIELFFV
ncbi:hypothetical protein LMF32_06515 [Desemzia sp. C1]|uniref:hypothetical protein n=1 Tax=Desemzia sp. C1 TaxID=2892016 RepID=UPI001E2A5647|nr:hypothetical protein [Desemzia sp. C1]MCI3028748.1 hypothetical protein [Desemzia sp. C1]